MGNEVLLILSVFFIFSMTLVCFVLFGDKGLMVWTVIATITANIEVLILVRAFGMNQTLGNVMFASTFLVTDILSEVSGKKCANKAVNIGIFSSLAFILISQSWFLYTPASESMEMFSDMRNIFSNTPRLMIVGFLVYALVQRFDVFLYHKWWDFTKRLLKDSRKALWIRNNGSTLISQLFNTVLFTIGAFWGLYDVKTLGSIAISSYVIFIFTSILDTPFVYLARMCRERNILKAGER